MLLFILSFTQTLIGLKSLVLGCLLPLRRIVCARRDSPAFWLCDESATAVRGGVCSAKGRSDCPASSSVADVDYFPFGPSALTAAQGPSSLSMLWSRKERFYSVLKFLSTLFTSDA